MNAFKLRMYNMASIGICFSISGAIFAQVLLG